MPVEHAVEFVAAGDAEETLAVQGVEMNVQPAQAGAVQGFSLFGEQQAVGGERQIVDTGDGGELGDQHVNIFAQQGLAAGEADLANAKLRGDAGHAGDLLERQDLRFGQKLHAFLGHAVEAADVAAVRDADAQIVVEASEGVDERGWHRESARGYFTANIRSMGSAARRRVSASISTRGSSVSRQSRSFSSVLSRM